VALPALATSTHGAYWKTDGQLSTFRERSFDALSLLDAADRDRALNLLFGAEGLRFSFGRIPIGASDYAIDRYTLDETPGDTAMSQFSIERDKQKLIPYIKAALLKYRANALQ
jgi:glucosylceramidase